MRKTLLMTAGAVTLALPLAAHAQNATSQNATMQNNRQVATQCLQNLQQMRDRMQKDGYWLSGYRSGWGWGASGYGVGAAGATPATRAGTTAATGTAAAPANGGMMNRPWGDVTWNRAPGYDMRVLYNAAHILANRGDEQGCEAVASSLQASYRDYSQQLQQAGVNPEDVTTWREEQIATAQPVTKVGRSLNVDAVEGTDVRNLKDEYLGSIEDVTFGGQNGQSYAIISRGGFLGIGEDYVAVPWNRLQVTQGLNTFVLPVSEEAFDNAPAIDPDSFASRETYQNSMGDIDVYWNQQDWS